MKKKLHRNISRPEGLKELRQPAGSVPSSEEFWFAFRERAARIPQEASQPYASRPWFAPALSMAAVLVAAFGFFWLGPTPSVVNGLQVEVLEASASSYMIWDDAAGRGTLLWLMDSGSVGEGGS